MSDLTPAQAQASAMAVKEGTAPLPVPETTIDPNGNPNGQMVQKHYIWPSRLQATNKDDADVLHLAQTVYSEMAGVKDRKQYTDYVTMAASSAENLYNKKEFKGKDYDTYLHDRFYAISRPNVNTPEAMNGNFDTPEKQWRWKKAMQVSYGVKNGLLDKTSDEFYYTPKEVDNLKRGGNFDFSQVEKIRDLGQYSTYRYKQSEPEKLQAQLKKAGFYDGEVDGQVGPMTKRAIKEFQSANGLKADGIVGKQTKAALMGS